MRSAISMGLAASVVSVVISLLGFSSLAAADEAIDVGSFYFCDPSNQNAICQTTITAGETITWSVVDGFHTVSQCTGQTFSGCPAEGGFDSGQIALGAQFEETFDTPGTFYYLCQNHPSSMRGIINVEAQETPTPSSTEAPTLSPTTTAAPSSTVTPTPASVPSTGAADSASNSGSTAIPILGALAAAAAVVLAIFALRRDSANAP